MRKDALDLPGYSVEGRHHDRVADARRDRFRLDLGGSLLLHELRPFIGIIIALIPPVIIAWSQYGPMGALLVFVLYEIVDNTISYIVMPRVMGKDVDVSMTVGILNFFLFAWLLCPIGAILSYPYTLVIKDVVLGSSEDTRWLSELMNMGMPDPVEATASVKETEATTG